MTADERRHPKGTVPTHHGVAAEVIATDGQRELVASSVALLGVVEVMNGAVAQVPQDMTIASVIASTDMRANLGVFAIRTSDCLRWPSLLSRRS